MSLHPRDRNRAGLAYCLNLVIAELHGQVFHLRGNEKAPVGADLRLDGRRAYNHVLFKQEQDYCGSHGE